MLNFKKNSLGTPLKVNSFVTCYQMDYKIKKSWTIFKITCENLHAIRPIGPNVKGGNLILLLGTKDMETHSDTGD